MKLEYKTKRTFKDYCNENMYILSRINENGVCQVVFVDSEKEKLDLEHKGWSDPIFTLETTEEN